MRNCALVILVIVGLSWGGTPNQQNVLSPIDGASNSGAIPDREAYLSLFLRFSDGPRQSPVEARMAVTRAAGLSEGEAAILIRAANAYRVKYDALIAQIQTVKRSHPARPFSAEALARFDAIAAEGWKSLQEARVSMETSLGPQASNKLSKMVDSEIKPHLIVMPGK